MTNLEALKLNLNHKEYFSDNEYAQILEMNGLDEFEEYKIPQEPILQDESIEFIKSVLKNKKMSVVNFLKSFPRKRRVYIVDMLRGAYPLPIDFKELKMIGETLDLDKNDIYNLWEERLKQVLEASGMNLSSNAALINAMFECARKYVDV